MNKKTYSFVGLLLDIMLMGIVASCDNVDEGISYVESNFEVGNVKWSSDVTEADRAVISNLLQNMVKVEACHFQMGAQARNSRRANYYSSFIHHDTIWQSQDGLSAFWTNPQTKGKDTLWYDVKAFQFEDSIKNKNLLRRCQYIYKSGHLWVGPVVEVEMPDYFIGKFEITQGEWEAVMHTAPSGHYSVKPTEWTGAAWYEGMGKGDRVAAYNIWYEDALAFCKELNRKTGLNFRLPTEAEWECAARGGKYCRGYRYSGSDTYSEVAWYESNASMPGVGSSAYGIHAGGEKLPNELGICDMCGNVSEWVANSYYRYSWKDRVNPQGNTPNLDGKDTLIQRGGSWRQSRPTDFSVANRKQCIMSSYTTADSLQSAFMNCGFRIAIAN